MARKKKPFSVQWRAKHKEYVSIRLDARGCVRWTLHLVHGTGDTFILRIFDTKNDTFAAVRLALHRTCFPHNKGVSWCISRTEPCAINKWISKLKWIETEWFTQTSAATARALSAFYRLRKAFFSWSCCCMHHYNAPCSTQPFRSVFFSFRSTLAKRISLSFLWGKKMQTHNTALSTNKNSVSSVVCDASSHMHCATVEGDHDAPSEFREKENRKRLSLEKRTIVHRDATKEQRNT